MKELPGPRKILILGVLFTSFSSILIRYTSAHPLLVASLRMAFASLLMAPLFLRGLRHGLGGKRFSLPGRKDLFRMILSGLFLGAHFATWISSLRLTSVASSVLLVSTHPLIVMILASLFLKEAISGKGWAALFLVLLGTLLLSLGDLQGAELRGESPLLGNLLALAGAFFVAFYMLIGRNLRGRIDLVPYTTIVYTASLFLLIPVTLMAGLFSGGGELFIPSLRDLLLCFALALFSTLLGHSLYNYALKFLPAGTVSISVLLEPVIASLLAVLLFQEIPPGLSLAGGLIVICGIALQLNPFSKKRPVS